MHSTNHRVRVVGMEDDTKALSEQQYGVVLHVLAAKKRPMGKVGKKNIKRVATDPDSARTAALAAADYVPPKECDKKQGDMIILNTGFSHCGQRGLALMCKCPSRFRWFL